MADQLLVRLFNVGLGDCIYLKIPDRRYVWHILIDCGNKFSSIDELERAIQSLEKELPEHRDFPGRKRLDLLLVTHPHEDHHKGFEADYFKGIKIDRIWLSPAFDRLKDSETHIDAKNGFQVLQQQIGKAVKRIPSQALAAADADLRNDLLRLSKDEAIEILTDTSNPHAMPAYNQVEPLFVDADTPPEKLIKFKNPAIHMKILAPEKDIDKFYLGGIGSALQLAAGESGGINNLFPDPDNLPEIVPPTNISLQDFNRLRNVMQANLLAAADVLGHATNNLSVILLLVWHGNRLLFTGDAEWSSKKGEVNPNGNNGSWNVMWQERKADLSKPLDFLKVGHHGSINATPWTPPKSGGEEYPLSKILDELLPLPEPGKSPSARAVVSTERTSRWPSIPDPEIINQLGQRVVNVNPYTQDKKIKSGTLQPQRTDLEKLPEDKLWIDVTFTPKP
jgi:beta-lactamase superfamily II metal-dependent hydrolase